MRQALAIFHHTALSLLRIEGHFLNGKVLIFLLCLSLQNNPLKKKITRIIEVFMSLKGHIFGSFGGECCGRPAV